MGKGALGVTCPFMEMLYSVFALVATAKRSGDKLFMHYFHNPFFAGAPSLDPAGALSCPDP